MNEVNEALIREVMAHIRANTGLWDQAFFVGKRDEECGTTHCFAGWTLRLSGFGILDGCFHAPEWMELPGNLLRPAHDKRGRCVNADTTAQHLLGFSDEQASHVFYALQQTDVEEFAQALEQVTGLEDL